MIDNIKDIPLIDLAHRLNQIRTEQQKLDMEYNQIVYELWDRIPSLENDENIKPKVIKKGSVNNGKNI